MLSRTVWRDDPVDSQWSSPASSTNSCTLPRCLRSWEKLRDWLGGTTVSFVAWIRRIGALIVSIDRLGENAMRSWSLGCPIMSRHQR
jgi:hypothetical protein